MRDWKRIGRAAVCLLVICCMVVNVSPIRANAVAAEAVGLGLAALLILATAGVVFHPETAAEITAVGQNMQTYMYQWGTSAEKLDEVESWLDSAHVITGGSGDDGDDESPHEKIIRIGKTIAVGLTAWVCSFIRGSSVEVEEAVSAGYAYYNGILLPEFPAYDTTLYPYALITYYPDGSEILCQYHASQQPYTFSSSATDYYLYAQGGYILTSYMSSENRYSSTASGTGSFRACIARDVIWSNYDFSNSKYTFKASDPLYVTTTDCLPDTFVGDIPAGIQDGTLAEEDIVLPDINYGALVNSDATVQDDIVNALGNLADGSMTYDDYMSLTQAPAEILSIDVNYDTSLTASPGSDIQCTAQFFITGSGSYDNSVVWSITGNTASTTTIDQNGLLHIGADETSQWINVFATSMTDASKFGSVSIPIVIVELPEVTEPDGTEPTEPDETEPTFPWLDDVQQDLSDIESSVGNVGDKVDQGNTKLDNLIEKITSLPDRILDGIKSLFVPDADAMAAQHEKWNELLSDRFGAVYESADIIDEIAESFTMPELQGQIQIPLVTVPLGEIDWTIGGWTVDVVPDGFEWLIEIMKKFIDILCTFAFVNAMKNRYERVLGDRA